MQVCIDDVCKPPCPPGMRYEGQVCQCDRGATCGIGSRRTCCAEGQTCRGNRCVTAPAPDTKEWTPLRNWLNTILQTAGAHGGSRQSYASRHATAPPVAAALVQLATVNALRGLAMTAFTSFSATGDIARSSPRRGRGCPGSLPAEGSRPRRHPR